MKITKKRAYTVLEVMAVVVGVAILAAVLFPVFFRTREPVHGRASCQSHLKQIMLGIKQYVGDYDEKFPRVSQGGQGWGDLIQPYLKSTQVLQDPQEASARVDGTTDYFYNARLSAQNEAKLPFIGSTIMMGDGIPDSPTDASLSQFPATWATDSNSPAWRHLEGANYSYADGHVKWLKPENISNDKAKAANTTFAIR